MSSVLRLQFDTFRLQHELAFWCLKVVNGVQGVLQDAAALPWYASCHALSVIHHIRVRAHIFSSTAQMIADPLEALCLSQNTVF